MRSYEKRLWLLILLLTAAVVYAVFFLVPPAMGLGSLVRRLRYQYGDVVPHGRS